MDHEHEKVPSPIRIVDRRRFDDDGTPREGVEDRVQVTEPAAAPATSPPAPPRQPSAGAASPFAPQAPATPPPRPTASPVDVPKSAPNAPHSKRPADGPQLDFAHFCLSLASSAQMAMGLVANPHTRVVTKDLAAAQQTIEILGMLQQKTEGNLTPEEAQLLTEVMYALRMQFVEASKAGLPKT